jgi:hypothetical protein
LQVERDVLEEYIPIATWYQCELPSEKQSDRRRARDSVTAWGTRRGATSCRSDALGHRVDPYLRRHDVYDGGNSAILRGARVSVMNLTVKVICSPTVTVVGLVVFSTQVCPQKRDAVKRDRMRLSLRRHNQDLSCPQQRPKKDKEIVFGLLCPSYLH